MTHWWREVFAVLRLDILEAIRSRWMLFAGLMYAVLAATFVFVGMRESRVLEFSGMGRVLISMVHALVLVLPLLALAATTQVINRARDDGTLEFLFSHPVRRSAYFVAVSMSRVVVLNLPLVALFLAMALVGRFVFLEPIDGRVLVQAMAVGSGLLWCYVGLGIAISTFVRNQARSIIWALLIWVLGAALLDFGLIAVMLRWRLHPQSIFLLAALNPVQAARMALLSGAETQLSVLGPVGFYMANRLGQTAVYTLGLLWPVALGLVAWLFAKRSFERTDIV